MATRSAIGRLDGASVSARTIYVGGIAVAGGDYTNSPGTDPGGDAVPIDGLDALVTRRHRLDFVLDYPFERPYEGHVIGDAGITLRQIIDAVRAGYRTMYRGATVGELGNLHNKSVDGNYGRAVHVIGDLVIERIDVDDGAGRIELMIGS
jgi:hypothetical protein